MKTLCNLGKKDNSGWKGCDENKIPANISEKWKIAYFSGL
jgi:hypothetical protein